MPKLMATMVTRGLVEAMEGRRQDWVADRAGISHSHFNEVLRGKKCVSRKKAERIAAVLGRPLDDLFKAVQP